MTRAIVIWRLQRASCWLRRGHRWQATSAGEIHTTDFGTLDTVSEVCTRCGRAMMTLRPRGQ